MEGQMQNEISLVAWRGNIMRFAFIGPALHVLQMRFHFPTIYSFTAFTIWSHEKLEHDVMHQFIL